MIFTFIVAGHMAGDYSDVLAHYVFTHRDHLQVVVGLVIRNRQLHQLVHMLPQVAAALASALLRVSDHGVRLLRDQDV